MSLADVYLKSSDVKATTIEMRQTLWKKGLREQVGEPLGDGYVEIFDNQSSVTNEEKEISTDHNVSTWTFNRSSGYLESFLDNAKSAKTKDDYFVPVPELTRIEPNRLVLVYEGSNFKLNLPDIRGSSKIPVRFQLIDYVADLPGLMLR